MEDPTSPTTTPVTEPALPWACGLAQSLDEQRRQIEEFLAGRRERMGSVESELTDGLVQLVDELVRSRNETNIARDELHSRETSFRQEAEHIESMRADLDAARADLAAVRTEWEEARLAAEKHQSLLLQQIQKQQQEQQKQYQQLLAETARQQSALDEARSKQVDLQVAADNSEETERLTAQRDEALRSLEESERSLAEAHEKLFELANSEAKPGASAEDGTSAEDAEYQQRYELSLQDIRELKAENEELKEEITKAKSLPQTASSDSLQSTGQISWEAQKQQMLAALESEYNENDPEDVKQRTQIDEVVRKTERAISQKDDEIQELKILLENQSENIGAVAVGAAAFGEMLDNDEIVQEERESLKQLQEELRKKLSAAEIDISVERARMARQRVELEEKMRQLAQHQSSETPNDQDKAGDPEKPVRGRWLSRLGLNDLQQ